MNIDGSTIRLSSAYPSVEVQPQRANQATAQAESSKTESSKENISISQEGLNKLKEDQSAPDKASSKAKSPVDLIIEKLQEMIKNVKQRLEALNGDDSPEAKNQRASLLQELGSLNGSLMEAIKEKLKFDAPA